MGKGKKLEKLSKQQIMDYLWSEVELRQAHYWSIFNKFGGIIITIIVVPYIRPEVVRIYPILAIFFPSVAFGLSVICAWYLGAEYQRLRMVRAKYESLLFEDCEIPRMPKRSIHEKLFAMRIGTSTTIIWGLLLSALSLLSGVVHFAYIQ